GRRCGSGLATGGPMCLLSSGRGDTNSLGNHGTAWQIPGPGHVHCHMRGFTIAALLAALITCTATAMAEPASGPRETIDQRHPTTTPNTPSGLSYTAHYHAAGDE